MALTKVSYSMIQDDIVNVMDFGAVGDGVANDWEACQRAVDSIQENGGTVIFPAGKTFRIGGNTILIWGKNVSLMGYGATLYKYNNGGGAGNYGDALTILGKINGVEYYGPEFGATYTTRVLYTGPTTPSVNINIEGFTVTFGVHLTDSINGISGVNLEHVTVKNCVTKNATQTGFAFIATYGTGLTHLTLENCFSDGAGMQGFRISSYNDMLGVSGEVFAKLINCRTENTQLTTAVPFPDQYGLASSAYLRASGDNKQYQVSLDNCQFDATVHCLDGYRTTSFRNCRFFFVFALTANPDSQLMFDNCRFRDVGVATGFGGVESQFFARNTSNSKSVIAIKSSVFETLGPGDYNIYNRGFDIDVADCTGNMAVYSIDFGTEISSIAIKNCTLKNQGSSPIELAGESINISQSVIYSPINIIQAGEKSVTIQDNKFIVDATFTTTCVVVTNGRVASINNIIDYTNNSYATVLVAPIANTLLKTNQYLYAGGTELSYDQSYATATPSTGYWQRTSRIIQSAAAVGSPKAWVCTVAGAPGTWVSEGNL